MDRTAPLPLTEPPADALAGESVPRENDQPREEARRAAVEEVVAALRARGDPFRGMSNRELRGIARDRLDRLTADDTATVTLGGGLDG